jgi:uncharacterized membrane protein YfcA
MAVLTTKARMAAAIVAAVIVYLLADAGWSYVLKPIGLDYMHAFLAMFCGMLVGGYIANRNFIWVAVALNLFFSTLTYVLVARMRGQSPVDLLLEQHFMISLGSFAGAILGAWLGRRLAAGVNAES